MQVGRLSIILGLSFVCWLTISVCMGFTPIVSNETQRANESTSKSFRSMYEVDSFDAGAAIEDSDDFFNEFDEMNQPVSFKPSIHVVY